MRFLYILFLLFSINAFSQSCEPNNMYADSSAGVYPKPFDIDLNPLGGITDTACINEYFEFPLTAVVPDVIDYNGIEISISSLVLDSIGGLPSGMNYLCNPDDCVFDANTIGCMLLYGTPDATNTESVYDILVYATANTTFGPVALAFPGLLGSGNYFLYVNQEGNCAVNSNEELNNHSEFKILPNPNKGHFSIIANDFEKINFKIYNSIGQLIAEINKYDIGMVLNYEELEKGIYYIRIEGKYKTILKKVVFN